MHSVLMMRGDDIFAEAYWKPFHRDFCHRMYSQTKSFVGIAVGLLIEDGKISLSDCIADHFPEKTDGRILPPYLEELTVRDLLTMETAGETPRWFTHADPDRVHLYFAENSADHPGGMLWKYDSPGSQLLSVLVEKLSGMPLMEFLRERLFSHMGSFRNAEILKTKTEDSFGDSALLCTTRDMASFGRLLMNGGVWQGKRLMGEDFIRKATSPKVYNDRIGFASAFTQGYGYLIWGTREGGFAFNGMGCQLTVCLPEKNFLFTCTADNQGFDSAKNLIESALFEIIVDHLHPHPLKANPKAALSCRRFAASLQLMHLRGKSFSEEQNRIQGKTFVCRENPMGIRCFSFVFREDQTGEFHYENAQGEKCLLFGMGKNVFSKFPQDGYPTLHAGLPNTEGYRYDCAVSGIWGEESKLLLKLQIIDRYLGNALFTFSFRGNTAVIAMEKKAEDFLKEYHGTAVAEML